MTENVLDISTRKPVKPDIPEDATVAQWLNWWKKYIKDNKAKTVAIIGIDGEGNAFYDIIGVSEIDLLRIYREVTSIRAVIDDVLDPQIDVELEDEEEE